MPLRRHCHGRPSAVPVRVGKKRGRGMRPATGDLPELTLMESAFDPFQLSTDVLQRFINPVGCGDEDSRWFGVRIDVVTPPVKLSFRGLQYFFSNLLGLFMV